MTLFRCVLFTLVSLLYAGTFVTSFPAEKQLRPKSTVSALSANAAVSNPPETPLSAKETLKTDSTSFVYGYVYPYYYYYSPQIYYYYNYVYGYPYYSYISPYYYGYR